MQKLKIIYKKTGATKYVGHLELMEIIERALRRTSLPVKYSEGFNPRMKIEYGPPLPLGIEGLAEVLVIELDGWLRPDKVTEELAGKFPEGIKLLQVEIANPKAASLDSSAQASEYIFELEETEARRLENELPQFLKQNEIIVNKKSKAGIKRTNIRPMIFELELIAPQLRAVLQTSNHGTLRPRELCEILGIGPMRIVRTRVLYR
jgi:radical SAM-linked protein